MRLTGWVLAIVGLLGVFGLYLYTSSQFTKTTEYENSAVINADDGRMKTVVISSIEQKRIEDWVKLNDLNKYGEAKSTVYDLGEPLMKGGIKIYRDRYQYILARNVSRPWNDGTESDEKALIEAWIKSNSLNEYGDPSGTAYIGATPLFDEKSGKAIDKYDYIRSKHADRPWAGK